MLENPLAPPGQDSQALGLFLRHFGLASERTAPHAKLLGAVARAFSRLPYENLTKIIKHAREKSPERSRRGPLEVVREHIARGAGGTCFSLTAAFLHLVRALGFEAEPILADRHYGPNTHCALLVRVDGAAHLLDPGFLIVRPVALDGGAETRIENSFNQVILVPRASGEKIDLHTVQDGKRVERLTYRTSPVDAGEFLKAWDASFDWDMMRYPLLTRVEGGVQVYLHERRLLVRTREGSTRAEVPLGELPARIAKEFGIAKEIAERAIEVLKRKGELWPRPKTRTL